MKKLRTILILAAVSAAMLIPAAGAGATSRSPIEIKLVSGLPSTMSVGQSVTVTVKIASTQPFKSAQAMPDDQYPGKGVVAHGGDRSGAGTSATLGVTFTAKGSTSSLPGGMDQVAVVAGARYPNGQTASQRFDFTIAVP